MSKKNDFKIKSLEDLGITIYKDFEILKFGTFNYLILKDKNIVGHSISLKKCKKMIDKANGKKTMIYTNLPNFLIN